MASGEVEQKDKLVVSFSTATSFKLIAGLLFYAAVTLVWAVRMDYRMQATERSSDRMTQAVELLTKIDQKTSDFDHRLDRIEDRAK